MLSLFSLFFFNAAYAESNSDMTESISEQDTILYHATAIIHTVNNYGNSYDFVGGFYSTEESFAVKEARNIALANLNNYISNNSSKYEITSSYSSRPKITYNEDNNTLYEEYVSLLVRLNDKPEQDTTLYHATAIIHAVDYYGNSYDFGGDFYSIDESFAVREARSIALAKINTYISNNSSKYDITQSYSSKPKITISEKDNSTLYEEYVSLSVRLNNNIVEVENKPLRVVTEPSNGRQVTARSEPTNYDYLYDKNKFQSHSSEKNKSKAMMLSLGIPMVISGIVCEGLVVNDNVKASKLTGQSIKSLYDGIEDYPNWEFSDEAKSEHKMLITSGAILSGVGTVMTVIGVAW